jgi:NADH dehydrogenase
MDRTQGYDAGSSSVGTRIVVVGGGFGGAFVVRRLERLFRRWPGVDIVLVSPDNYFLMTPLLFEACSGTLEFRHCSMPLRAFLRKARFVEAAVRHIDQERRVICAAAPEGSDLELPYDQLVLALGSATDRARIPGSESAFTFKTLADAVLLRNHLIERFERADVEVDATRKRQLLTFAVIGGGLVGIELLGELTAFVDGIVRFYRRVRRDEVRFFLLQASDRILPEIVPRLAEYASRVLSARPGVNIRAGTPVWSIEPGRVRLPGETIAAGTVVLAAGVVPHPLVAGLPVEKDRNGRVMVDGAMRCPSRPEVWALGDCASIPGPDGKPYPMLAQHALREAKALAGNIHAVLTGKPPRPFTYRTLGVMGSLGHCKGFGQVLGVRVRGFLAWWVRRTYYLMQMPGWGRRLHVIADWTAALLFRPDIVKIDLASEASLLLRDSPAGAAHPAGVGPRTLPLGSQADEPHRMNNAHETSRAWQ